MSYKYKIGTIYGTYSYKSYKICLLNRQFDWYERRKETLSNWKVEIII